MTQEKQNFDALIHNLQLEGKVTNVVSRTSRTYFQTLDGSKHGFMFDVHNPDRGVIMEVNIVMRSLKASDASGLIYDNKNTDFLSELVTYFNGFA